MIRQSGYNNCKLGLDQLVWKLPLPLNAITAVAANKLSSAPIHTDTRTWTAVGQAVLGRRAGGSAIEDSRCLTS